MKFIFILMGLVTGSGATYALLRWQASNPPAALHAQAADAELLQKLRTELQASLDQELADYARLKTLEEKYQRADEILGRVMVMLLVNLGIKVSPEFRAHLQNSVRGEAARLENLAATAAAQKAKEEAKLAKADTAKANLNEVGAEAATPFERDLSKARKAERKLEDLRSEDDIQGFLAQTRLSAPKIFFTESQDFSNQQQILNLLNGTFSGLAQVTIEQRPETWQVEVNLEAQMQGNELHGKAGIKLSKNGEAFSSSGDEGGISSLREFSGGTRAMVLNASPTTFFQVYYLRQLNSLVGNVYRKPRGKSEYEWIGTLSIRKG